jgi:hypothetical protein
MTPQSHPASYEPGQDERQTYYKERLGHPLFDVEQFRRRFSMAEPDDASSH